jgi:hypothetical protein
MRIDAQSAYGSVGIIRPANPEYRCAVSIRMTGGATERVRILAQAATVRCDRLLVTRGRPARTVV